MTDPSEALKAQADDAQELREFESLLKSARLTRLQLPPRIRGASPEVKREQYKREIDEMLGRITYPEPFTEGVPQAIPKPFESSPKHKFCELEMYFAQMLDDETLRLVKSITPERGKKGAFPVMGGIKCLGDLWRTKCFAQSIQEVVADFCKRTAHTNEPMSVVDAGSGAFPFMAMYAALQDPRVRVTCIEHNPRAAAIAKAIVDKMGLGSQIEVVAGDILQFKRPKDTFDLVISETMNSAFATEYLQDHMTHLRDFTKPAAKFMPERVEIYAGVSGFWDTAPSSGPPKQQIRLDTSNYYFLNIEQKLTASSQGQDNTGSWKKVATWTPEAPLDTIKGQLTVGPEEDKFGFKIHVASRVYLPGVDQTTGESRPVEIAPERSLITSRQDILNDAYNGLFYTEGKEVVEFSYKPGELEDAWVSHKRQ